MAKSREHFMLVRDCDIDTKTQRILETIQSNSDAGWDPYEIGGTQYHILQYRDNCGRYSGTIGKEMKVADLKALPQGWEAEKPKVFVRLEWRSEVYIYTFRENKLTPTILDMDPNIISVPNPPFLNGIYSHYGHNMSIKLDSKPLALRSHNKRTLDMLLGVLQE